MTRVFISHSSKDAQFVLTHLKPMFDRLGIAAWCSATDVRMASDWERQIRAALAQADWFTVVMSPDAQKSPWVQAETHWALEHRPGRVVPIMARDCEPSEIHLRLGTLQYIDFRGGPEDAVRRLQETLSGDHGSEPVGRTKAPPAGADDPLAHTTLIARARRADLRLFVEPAAGSGYEVTLVIRNWMTIGRADDVDLRLADDCTSRRHARITVVPTMQGLALNLTDLESANGTFVNREHLVGIHRLEVGDVIEIGNCRLTIRQIVSAAG
jgi:hypothetical protein